jgi:hypothetical protein
VAACGRGTAGTGLCVARHDTPLIGERAATRGHVATEGDDERDGVMRRHPSCTSLANRIEWRER